MNDILPIVGGCRCGAGATRLGSMPSRRLTPCHCLDCQSWSGSAFSQNSWPPEDAITITGPIPLYEREGTGGRISRQRVCAVCHTRIYNTNSIRPGVIVLRAGTLDRSDELACAAHIWTKRSRRGSRPDGVPSWPETPPLGDTFAAVGSSPPSNVAS